jgi:predicted dienelactone hydrolase
MLISRGLTRPKLTVGVATVGLLLAVSISACGGTDGSEGQFTSTAVSTTEPASEPATTTAAAPAPTTTEPNPIIDLSVRGPYPVGVTTWELQDGAFTEVWYPAVSGGEGSTQYDFRDYTPDFLAPLLANVTSAVFEYSADRDQPVNPDDAAFPLVVFSHGFAGMRVQSTFLTAHLASYGMVVASPDHSSRDLRNVLGATATGDQREAIGQLSAVIDLATEANSNQNGQLLTSPSFVDRIDLNRIALIGHSAGGASVQGAATDPRVNGFVAMAAGGPPEGFEVAQVPSLFLAGSTDGVISPTERTRPAHLAAAVPSWYLEIAQTGHNGFDDFCLLGNGTGIIGVAEEAGLGAILQAQPALRTLGEDGCLPPAAPVDLAHPVITHAVTVWLQWLFTELPDLSALNADHFDRFALGSVLAKRQ